MTQVHVYKPLGDRDPLLLAYFVIVPWISLDHLWILDEMERLAGVSYGVSVSRVSWLSSG